MAKKQFTTPRKCENPDCPASDMRILRVVVEGKGTFRVCPPCYRYTKKTGKLRTAQVMKEAEELKKFRKQEFKTCENPNCQSEVKQLTGTFVEGHGRLKLCAPCRYFATKYGVLRPAKFAKKLNKLKSIKANCGGRCYNKNCRTTNLDKGMVGKHNGKFYCHLCAYYVNNHNGVERPKSVIDAWGKPKDPPYCENPNCGEESKLLKRAEVEGEGTFRLCETCYMYNANNKKLRPLDRVQATQNLRELRKLRKTGEDKAEERCFNPNCRTTLLEGGGYGIHNHKFYCRPCALYVNRHGGEERPQSKVDARNVELVACENENCDVKSVINLPMDVPGKGTIGLCPVCYAHFRRAKKLRSAEQVQRVGGQKRRRVPGEERCHNPNCETVDLQYGCYAEDGEYYCEACHTYMKLHDGKMRSKKLADASKLRKSRYMWRLKHPDRIVDEVE